MAGCPLSGSAALAGVAVRLRLALLRGSLRSGPGSTGRQLGLVLGALLGALLAGGALALLTAVRGSDELAESLAVLLFNLLLLGWVLLPLLTFSGDDLMDPSRLALLPLTGRQVLTVLGVGALVGVAPIFTLVAALGLLPATGTGPASYLVGLCAVALLLALCVGTSRALAAALSGVLRSRRGRDVGVALGALVAVGAQLINPLLQLSARRASPDADLLAALAAPLRWTPAGVLATAPGRSLPAATACLLAGAAVLGVVLVLWERSVRRALERPDASGAARRRSTALTPRLLPLPRSRVGAVAAKDLRYLTREPRRVLGLVTALLVPAAAVIAGPVLLSEGGAPRWLVFAACGVAVLGGLTGANRFGQDGSATWLLVSTGTDRRDARRDLLGGDLAQALLVVPGVVAVAAALAALTDGWVLLAPAVGLALALVATATALSGAVAVHAPFPVPPSQNAFSAGSAGQGCASGAVTLAAIVGSVLMCLPLLALLVPALRSDGPVWGLLLLVAGPAYGLAVGELVRRATARAWAQRGPDVVQVLLAGRT